MARFWTILELLIMTGAFNISHRISHCVNVYFFLVSEEKETMTYFAAHFEQQIQRYKTLVSLLK